MVHAGWSSPPHLKSSLSLADEGIERIFAVTYLFGLSVPAGKLAWFLGWWASKERKGPHIPGLDMVLSNKAKAAWTQAVVDAAVQGGLCVDIVEAAHTNTMAYAAQALLQRLLVSKPLFAAAVVKEMQEM